jgi:hypothetical protein
MSDDSTNNTAQDLLAKQNNERLNRRNMIADSADEFRSGDMDDIDGGRPVNDDRDDEDDGTVTQHAEDTNLLHKIKVNGKELQLSYEELVQRAQKVESADEYLRHASESVKNATKLALSTQDEPKQMDDDDLALARAIQMGSEDEAVQAIRKIKSRPSEVTPDAVARVVDERLSFQRAAEWFNNEYKELLTDPNLKKLVLDRDAELAQLEPQTAYMDRLRRVGDEIRGWNGQRAGTPKVDKAARKAQVASVPSGAARQNTGANEESDDSPESVIALMAKSRGQARSVQH